MKRQRKKYSRPQRPFDKIRIDEENVLKDKYGLKNKKEIWRAEAAVSRYRGIAKKLITSSTEEQEAFISKLVKKGILKEDSQIDDVLDMKKEDYLNRRLQTILFKKGLSKSLKHARQLVTHRFVIIKDRIINVHSYAVDLSEEKGVKLVALKPKAAPKPVMEDQTNAN